MLRFFHRLLDTDLVLGHFEHSIENAAFRGNVQSPLPASSLHAFRFDPRTHSPFLQIFETHSPAGRAGYVSRTVPLREVEFSGIGSLVNLE